MSAVERRQAGAAEWSRMSGPAPASGSPPQDDSLSLDSSTDQWFRALAETTSTAILVLRETFLYANPAAERLLGLSAAELSRMAPPAVVHPDYREVVRRRFEARLRGEEVPSRYEMKILRHDGLVRWIDYSAQGITLGNTRAVLATAIDITDTKRYEQRLQLLVEGTSRAIGADFFPRLVRCLAEAFETRCALAARVGTGRRASMLSLWKDGDYAEVGEVELAGDLSPIHGSYRQGDERPFPLAPVADALGTRHYLMTPMIGSGGEVLGVLGILGDQPIDQGPAAVSLLTMFAQRSGAEMERLDALRDLSREKEYAQVTLASIADGVVRTDARGRVDFLNPVASWILGWRPEEAVGLPVSTVFPALDEATRKEVEDPVALCLRKQKSVAPPMSKVVSRRTDGAEFSVRDSVAPIRDRSGKVVGAVLVFKDVTELRGMQREMQFLEEHEPLTGLINRQAFERQLDATLGSDRPATDSRPTASSNVLCVLDLDEFQLVNDTFGPAAGDEMLQRVAALVRRRVRESDIVARLGSDEFGILFSGCSRELARSLVESIRDGLAQEVLERGGQRIGCSAGFGLVPFSSSDTDVAEILTLGHGACFLARRQGRNQIYDYQPGDPALTKRLDEAGWVHRIRSAFEEDRFLLYHQPFASLGGDRVPISEIFLRLDGEGGELLSPGALIRAAERYHLISRIDRWVVRKALKTLSRSAEAEEEPERIYTINLSGLSLGEEGFLEDVSRELQETAFDPRRICFEITETAAIANLDAALRFFTRLRALGCRFLLDDFGSGMSSLAYLKNLPVDYLKIDGEFVQSIVRDPVQRAMVESIHRISRVLGLKTIGECVEEEASLEALRDIGIDYAQGFWLAEPTPLA